MFFFIYGLNGLYGIYIYIYVYTWNIWNVWHMWNIWKMKYVEYVDYMEYIYIYIYTSGDPSIYIDGRFISSKVEQQKSRTAVSVTLHEN